MKNLLQKASTSLIISGVLSLLFGILAFVWPGITLVSLVWLFAISVIGQGIFQISAAVQNKKEDEQWWVLLLIGIVNLVAGILAIIYPHITAFFLVTLMAFTWLITGLLQVVAAVRLRKEIKNEGWLALSGIISIAIGIFLLVKPGEGAIAMIWIIATYAIIFGILLILLGVKAKSWTKDVIRRFDDVKTFKQ